MKKTLIGKIYDITDDLEMTANIKNLIRDYTNEVIGKDDWSCGRVDLFEQQNNLRAEQRTRAKTLLEDKENTK